METFWSVIESDKFISAVLIIIGWWCVHKLAEWRDADNRRQDAREKAFEKAQLVAKAQAARGDVLGLFEQLVEGGHLVKSYNDANDLWTASSTMAEYAEGFMPLLREHASDPHEALRFGNLKRLIYHFRDQLHKHEIDYWKPTDADRKTMTDKQWTNDNLIKAKVEGLTKRLKERLTRYRENPDFTSLKLN